MKNAVTGAVPVEAPDLVKLVVTNESQLTYQSLLGGMGARRIVETLARTGGFSTKVARHRMFETTQHILQCTNNLDSIKPGGAGHQSTIRVRLLHSAVRRRILKLAKERPSYYNVDELGIPISDLDSIGTIGSFSMTLIWLGLPRQGIFMREQEITDYIALWRYIAYLIGTPDEHFKDAKTAKTIMDSILLYEVNPSEVSQALANNIILSLQGLPPAYASANFLGANTYWLNGSGLSKDLGIPRPPAFYSLLVLGQCLFFCFTSYFYRAIPSLDKRKIRVLRELFWKVIISKEGGLGEETNFDFKYVPEFSVLTTEMGAEKREGLKTKGVERRNFITLLIMGAVFGMGSYWAVNTGMRVLAALRG